MLKTLVKFSASYTAIEGIQKGVLFLLLPLFTSYMTSEEYGIVSSILMTVSFLAILFSLAIHSGIGRYYFKYKDHAEELKIFLGTNFIIMSFISLALCILLMLFGETLFNVFLNDISFDPYVIYLLIIVSSQVVLFAYFSLLKAMQNLKQYAYLFNSYFLFQITLIYLLVVKFGLKQDGYILGILLSNILFLFISIILIVPHISFKINLKYFKEILSYSLPIIPVEIIGTSSRLIDRYYILMFIGLSGVGVYYVGVQIAGMVNLIAFAINSAYTPIFFKKYESSDDKSYEDIYRLADIIVFTIFVFTAIIILLYPFFLNLFHSEYQSIDDVIIYLIFSGALTSIYFLNTNTLSLEPNLVKLKTIGIIIGAILNFILGYFLTKSYGLNGAAMSALISFMITTLILIFIVRLKTKFLFSNFKYLALMLAMFLTVKFSIYLEYIYIVFILILFISFSSLFLIFNHKEHIHVTIKK